MKIIKRIVFIIALILCIPCTTIHASSDVYVEDSVGKLSSEQILELQNFAKEVSDTYQFGVYARIVEDPYGTSYDDMDTFSEEYYAQHDLGYGTTNDGVLLLIAFSNEGGSYQVMIPSNSNQDMFTLDGMDQMDDAAYSSLQNQDFYQAIYDYIEKAESLMAYYESNDEAYGSNYGYTRSDYSGIKYASVFGLPPVVALLSVLGLKSKHKTKKEAKSANDYIGKNGLRLTNQRDMFLYQTVTRVPIPRNTDRGGGISSGGSHFSSGGGMHSGGGHF